MKFSAKDPPRLPFGRSHTITNDNIFQFKDNSFSLIRRQHRRSRHQFSPEQFKFSNSFSSRRADIAMRQSKENKIVKSKTRIENRCNWSHTAGLFPWLQSRFVVCLWFSWFSSVCCSTNHDDIVLNWRDP